MHENGGAFNSDPRFSKHAYPLSNLSSSATHINCYNDKEQFDIDEPGNLHFNDEELQFCGFEDDVVRERYSEHEPTVNANEQNAQMGDMKTAYSQKHSHHVKCYI